MKKILILLIPVLLPIFSHAWDGTTPDNFSKTIPASEFSCNLPAPTNLVISNITAQSATGTWSSVPGAVAYYVEVRRTSNNSLVYSNTTAALTETATGLPSGEDLEFTVQAVCSNYETSPERVSRGFTTDVIIEVVMSGYNPPCQGHRIEVIRQYNVPGNDIFEGVVLYDQEYWLEISQTPKSGGTRISYYTVRYSQEGTSPFICTFQENFNETETPLGVIEGDLEPGSNHEFENGFDKILVKKHTYGNPMLEIKMTGQQNQLNESGLIKVTVTGEGWDEVGPGVYNIRLTSCGNGGENRSGDRDNDSWLEMPAMNEKPLHSIDIFPNPVQSDLYVMPPENMCDGQIVITDINGMIVYQDSISNYNTARRIDVSDLQTGIYFLKIETGETLKVSKFFKIK